MKEIFFRCVNQFTIRGMEMHSSESDDEVFFGKLTLKEIKKIVLRNKNHEVRRCTKVEEEENNQNKSLKIIEIHSEPNLSRDVKPSWHQLKAVSNPILTPNSSPTSPWDIKASDESFLKMEKMVSDLSASKEDKSVELDNTLDIINYILNNGPSENYENCDDKTNIKQINNTCTESTGHVVLDNEECISPLKPDKTDTANTCSKHCDSPINNKIKETDGTTSNKPYATPTKNATEEYNGFFTPHSDAKTKTPMFKTPGIPVSHRKTPASSVKKTPSKTNTYKHIASPVASYINNTPIVPLLKDVRPTKPLPGPSAIPKFMKSTCSKVENKENVNLPTIAYKSAKKTKVIDLPDKEKLPQSQWAKKITSSLPRPLVMKHDHREMKFTKRALVSEQENSFANLSLQQADVSVCTQRSAFNVPKKT